MRSFSTGIHVAAVLVAALAIMAPVTQAGGSGGSAPAIAQAPQAIHTVQPAYPAEARRSGIEGTVMVKILVGVDGKVKDAVVVKSVEGLDAAAVAALRQWTFRPAMSQGKAVATWVVVPVKFAAH